MEILVPKPRRFGLLLGYGSLLYPDGTEERLDDDWIPNALANEGEASVLNVYLREQANPAKHLALLNDATIAETDTMATMVESAVPGAGGYNRQQILAAEWGAPVDVSGDQESTAAEKTFGPNSGGGAWSVTHVAVVTAATGTAGLLVSFVPTATASVPVGVSYKFTFKMRAQ